MVNIISLKIDAGVSSPVSMLDRFFEKLDRKSFLNVHIWELRARYSFFEPDIVPVFGESDSQPVLHDDVQ